MMRRSVLLMVLVLALVAMIGGVSASPASARIQSLRDRAVSPALLEKSEQKPLPCPTCKKSSMRNSWPVEYNHDSPVPAYEHATIKELAHRVDYLIEPLANKLSIKEARLQKARKQIRDATNHHEAIQDFSIKYEGKPLIPKWMQEERQIVQLE